MPLGALINSVAIVAGGSLGLLLKGRIPRKASENTTRAIGLCVCIIGISSALVGDLMLLVISLTLGAFAGGLINIDGALDKLGLRLQKRLSKNEEKSGFAEGFVAATLLFCVGAMAIVGSLESGLAGDRSIIFTKSILDCVSAMILASSFGFGVLLSAVIVIFYQGGIEFFAGYLQSILTGELITQISAAGGIMILAIGLNMALKSDIKAANLLPGFLFAIAYFYLILN
ncbi:MAG: DUF554 domain-containing protein [Oscillospiraceae bacterium]|nr:DUF554 domain-containing protein [Oscillospiraceae bacterium]